MNQKSNSPSRRGVTEGGPGLELPLRRLPAGHQPPNARLRALTVAAAAGALVLGTLVGPRPLRAQDPGDGGWRQYTDLAYSGFSDPALESARAFVDSVGAGAVMAVHRGRVVAAWGDVAREFRAHSVRKSLVSALYGPAVAEGLIELDATTGELGIDDLQPLSESEKRARLRDLLSARSGIYHPAAYAPSSQDAELPARGSHPPDTYWFYNNWDFNVAGVAYELLTGEGLYESFARRIARPLGMEDWDVGDGFRVYEPTRSIHPALTFRISSRDLARVGQLFLQEGRWSGRQVIPAEWIRESTAERSDAISGSGYGYMWWTYYGGDALSPEPYPTLSRHDLYMARGTGGQGMWVVPSLALVVVVRGDTDNGEGVRGVHAWEIAERVAAALEDEPAADADLVPLRPLPLPSQHPAPPPPPTEHPDPRLLEELWGEYELAPGVVARIFEWQGTPFFHMPGEGDAELFSAPGGGLTIRVISGVHVGVERDAAGDIAGLVLKMGPQTLHATRLP